MEHKLASWKSRLETLTAQATDGGTSMKAVVHDDLVAWKAAGEAASAKLVEMRAAAARYGTLRGELETAWQAIADVLPVDPAASSGSEPIVKRAARVS